MRPERRSGALTLPVQFVIAALALLPFYVVFWNSLSGDAAIYFTFIKRFFEAPFTFQPQTVSFGATSPLHVILNVPIFHLLGESSWLPVGKTVNLLWIAVGLALVNAAVRGTVVTLLLACLLTATNPRVFTTASQLFETPLAFAGMALLYYLLKTRRLTQAACVAGLLYLVRPELVLVAAVVDLGIILRLRPYAGNRGQLLRVVLLSAAPAVAYHLYMWTMTGALVPTSVSGRALIPYDDAGAWIERVVASWRILQADEGRVYRLAAAVAAAIFFWRRTREYTVEFALVLPVLALYVIVPPLSYLPRYLLPIMPVLIAMILRVSMAASRRLFSYLPARGAILPRTGVALALGLIVVMLVRTAALSAADVRGRTWFDYDTLLLKDLGDVLNRVSTEADAVLLYEIQGQYWLRARCLSLDGIVGGQLLNALTRRESFEDFILRRPDVKYVVTSDAFDMRRIYAGTLLERLYVHDLDSHVGDHVTSGSLMFIKIASNPVFSDPAYYEERPWPGLNAGDRIRLYASNNAAWSGHVPLWNSVYRIERPR